MRKITFFLIFILFIFWPNFIYAQNLRIHFIDAGEGEAILIETPEHKNVLLDSGNLITGLQVVKYLKNHNIYTLDHLIFTHPDLDHIGGAFFILQMLKTKNIYDNGEDLTGLKKQSDIYRWYEDLVRRDKNYKAIKAQDSISLGNLTLRVLWPLRSFLSGDYNANSLVIMMEYGKFRCLLTADLTFLGEREILKTKEDLKADVLKIAHHGASDANSEEFLTRVSAKIAIISVDKRNIRGYPNEGLLERLKKDRVKLYRTDEDGDVTIDICQSKHGDFKIRVNKTR